MSKYQWKRYVSVFVAILLVCALLAGCGSNAPKSDGANQPTQADTAAKAESAGSRETAAPAELKGTVTMWGNNEDYIQKLSAEYRKTYPGVTIEHTAVNVGDYLNKAQTSVAAGMQLPDILWGEIGARGRLFSLDIWEDLEKAPYNFDRSSVFDYLIPIMSNADGKIVGIEGGGISPTGMCYNRELALKYFGTDDPEKLEALLPDWNTFIEKGKEVNKASGGKVLMLASIGDASSLAANQNQVAFAEGTTVNASDTIYKSLDLLVKMRDAGIYDKIDQFSPAWNASFALGKYIFYPCPPWFIDYVMKANDKDGKVSWGLMTPPGGGLSYGGTTFGITKTSQSKEQAWSFIQWCSLSLDGAKACKAQNVMTPFKAAYEDPSFVTNQDPIFGGQDIGDKFKTIASEMHIAPMSMHDASVNDVYNLLKSTINKDPNFTYDMAVKKFNEEIKNKLPEMEIK